MNSITREDTVTKIVAVPRPINHAISSTTAPSAAAAIKNFKNFIMI
jgi:hypothetical protein